MFRATVLLENVLPSGFFNDGVMEFSKTSIFSWAFVVPLMNFISPTSLGFMHPLLSKLPSLHFTVLHCGTLRKKKRKEKRKEERRGEDRTGQDKEKIKSEK